MGDASSPYSAGELGGGHRRLNHNDRTWTFRQMARQALFPTSFVPDRWRNAHGDRAHFGGEGVYLRGVAVDLKGERATGIEYYFPAQSTHVLMAGFAIALSLGALGASLRVVSTHEAAVEDQRADQELQELGTPTSRTEPRGN